MSQFYKSILALTASYESARLTADELRESDSR
jgi:hypothetical protein